MNPDSTEQLERLVSRLLDGQLSPEEAAQLDKLLAQSPAARVRYLELLDNHEALCAIYPGDIYEASLERNESAVTLPAERSTTYGRQGSAAPGGRMQNGWIWTSAALLLLAFGAAGYFLGRDRAAPPVVAAPDSALPGEDDLFAEQRIAGHATLRRALEVRWSQPNAVYREGDVLPDGVLQFDEGVVEIDFFCGATLMVEGPARMELESDWSVRFFEGRLRASVPPAARGFVVKAAGAEIIDLGTEFALEVGPENARVEVLNGEVKLQGGNHSGKHLVTGETEWLRGAAGNQGEASFRGLSTLDDIRQRSESAERQRFEAWQASSQQLRQDPRLIAYYPIAESPPGRNAPNAAASGSQLDAALVGPVDRVPGRLGATSAGLEFDRAGARARVRIDGEFQAFTFACWAKIDSLEHRYNALFMGDGYENGEPHWQIRDDGRLMFSVMVDDSQEVRRFNPTDQRIVQDAGLHRVYMSPPFWDVLQSGQWFHLAAVYDPAERRVMQFVNGKQISSQEIIDKFHIETLRIGPAEIGNWGQPFRDTPWFAVRNLNGAIDELAIFNAALTPAEISVLYEQGKPLSY